MKIAIHPVSVFSSQGTQVAEQFEVRHITYTPNNGALADTHLMTAQVYDLSGNDLGCTEVGTGTVIRVPQVLCDVWADDTDFIKSIVSYVGLTAI